ncbi:MAG TPA: type II toxin-antitoxin system CcdA family antitoxin [Egibacteraceae bacterium]|jgi:post-segregation antitoxin (ccd killing protein)|nr:type II toxin-antitoxin system CcdA family antitoxin [Egibacteraceae bacterium]
MAKRKISATLSPELIRQAQALTGGGNLSEVLEQGLSALIDRELERRWLAGYQQQPPAEDVPDDVPVDLREVPWAPRR